MTAVYQLALNKPVLALIGPTCTGKTQLSLALAQLLNGEILACDSVAVYRDVDIGSAKPSLTQQQQVPHHGLNVRSPDQAFNVGAYLNYAVAVVKKIHAQGKIAIVVGGSGLYFRVLRYGLVEQAPSACLLRQQWIVEEQHNPGILHQRLQCCDPQLAAVVHPHNISRLVRALEIYHTTGQPASQLRQAHGFAKPLLPMIAIWCDGGDDWLRQRIALRIEAMLRQGLVAEGQKLLQEYPSLVLAVRKAVGYRQVFAMLQEQSHLHQLPALIAKATWNTVRRQRTFLRREKTLHGLAMDRIPDIDQQAQFALACYQQGGFV